jgi:hypothetical protein
VFFASRRFVGAYFRRCRPVCKNKSCNSVIPSPDSKLYVGTAAGPQVTVMVEDNLYYEVIDRLPCFSRYCSLEFAVRSNRLRNITSYCIKYFRNISKSMAYVFIDIVIVTSAKVYNASDWISGRVICGTDRHGRCEIVPLNFSGVYINYF